MPKKVRMNYDTMRGMRRIQGGAEQQKRRSVANIAKDMEGGGLKGKPGRDGQPVNGPWQSSEARGRWANA
jgi:hypothetical protein